MRKLISASRERFYVINLAISSTASFSFFIHRLSEKSKLRTYYGWRGVVEANGTAKAAVRKQRWEQRN